VVAGALLLCYASSCQPRRRYTHIPSVWMKALLSELGGTGDKSVFKSFQCLSQDKFR
jgi:hypothetical protein